MLTQIQFYLSIVQLYFGVFVAAVVAAQPLLIMITSLAHAVEVQARNRGWVRINSVAYWTAKICGTFAVVDTRNVQRVGGKVFEILVQIIASWPVSKEAKTKAVTDAMTKLGPSLVLIACLSGVVSAPVGCSSTPAPRYPLDLAVTAVNATDAALAVAIETAPLDPDQTEAWTKRVAAVETAAALVRAGGDLCPSIPALQEAAKAASCEVCSTLLVTLASEASCQL